MCTGGVSLGGPSCPTHGPGVVALADGGSGCHLDAVGGPRLEVGLDEEMTFHDSHSRRLIVLLLLHDCERVLGGVLHRRPLHVQGNSARCYVQKFWDFQI